MKIATTLYANATAQIVAADAKDILGIEGVFYVHMEGSNRGCYKLAHQYKEELLPDNIYFLVKNAEFFKHHMSPVEGLEGIYRWEWNRKE